MHRRAFLNAMAGGLLAAPLAAGAQQPEKVWRVGYLGNTPLTDPVAAGFFEALRHGLQEHGYVEGRNLVIERRISGGVDARLPAFDRVEARIDDKSVQPRRELRAAAKLLQAHTDLGERLLSRVALAPRGSDRGHASFGTRIVPTARPPYSFFSYTTFPPTTVVSTFTSRTSFTGHVSTSRSMTIRSPNLPTSRLPFSFSS